MIYNEEGNPVFDDDAVVACHVTGCTTPTVFGAEVDVIVEFTFEDIHGNEQVELSPVTVRVPEPTQIT